MIRCRICLNKKDENCFYFRKDSKTYRTNCIECIIVKQKLKYEQNSEKKRAYAKEYLKNNSEKIKEYQKINKDRRSENAKKRRKLNPEKYREKDNLRYKNNVVAKLKSVKKYYETNREKRLNYRKNYVKIHRAECSCLNRIRQLRKINATPNWLTVEHKETMKEIYKESKRMTETTGIEHNVDHIVPLRSDLVCGLHVPWNLQILTKKENSEKSNRLLNMEN